MTKNQLKDAIRSLHASYLRARARHVGEFVPNGKVLIIAPHPDDEVIGCGGLIARLVEQGNPPHILFLTGGGGSHRGCCSIAEEEIIKQRRKLTSAAMAILGVPEENLHFAGFKDGSVSAGFDAVIDSQSSILNSQFLSQFATILVPHWAEGWSDHVCVRTIVERLLADALEGRQVVEYCVWMWYYNAWRGLDWRGARALRLSPAEHEKKQTAMRAYVEPLAPCGTPWSGRLPRPFLAAHTAPLELYFA